MKYSTWAKVLGYLPPLHTCTCWTLLQSVACWSWSLHSNCPELKIVQKILSGSTVETGPGCRHSSIISAPHTPSTFVHIHSCFLTLSHICDFTNLSGKSQAGHWSCFELLALLFIYNKSCDRFPNVSGHFKESGCSWAGKGWWLKEKLFGDI